MPSEKVFEIRYITPPVLVVLTLFLFSPTEFISFLLGNKYMSLVVGGALILGFGFVISSATEFFINLFFWKVHPKARPKFPFKKSFKLTDTSYKESLALQELEVWGKLEGDSRGHVRTQVHKRWNMAVANFNSVGAIIFGFIFFLVLYSYGFMTPPKPVLSLLTSIVFILIFYLNGKRAVDSIHIMTKEIRATPEISK